MEVMLPESFNRKSMYSFISEIISLDRNPVSEQVIFNFRNLKFIEPVGVTVLSNISQWLNNRGVKVSYRTPKIEAFNQRRALCYLDDSLFFEQHIGSKKREYAAPRATTRPLKSVKVDESYQWFDGIVFWLSGRLGLTTESLANLKMCLKEIFNNINDHSKELLGCAFVQHYPYKNEVSIAISDFGVGIPYNIQALNPSLNDAQCLLKAVEEGYSTKSNPRNRGAGLITLIDNVVKDNKGTVYIHSNHGILECKYKQNEVVKSPLLKRAFYPGTLIEINLRTDNIENVEYEEEEFEW